MNLTRNIMFATLAIVFLMTGSAISGPCCADVQKKCAAVKKCDPLKNPCTPDKTCDSACLKNCVHKKTSATIAPEKTILFFMNPNGRPCQIQLEVLDEMKEKLSPLAKVTYIKTTESADRNKFSEYGIRGLPFLIIVDKTGKELHRFTPGVQQETAILDALKQE